ncbi:hypothetical protein CCACVL1_10792 [Corchorus capsularis]|uniref:Uncharacterized protein n=1 Tax=Corchorus capsularis TaxID=210143 RepID=A0A1R3IPM8_COCAP|nr:hypothetical protein CCACVL1_10792 [Corchorus capsularis]
MERNNRISAGKEAPMKIIKKRNIKIRRGFMRKTMTF